ncbi:DUF4349 domain-containing protein [Gracilibacillus timonensis]|uniref:DUF4349 domain-containing protein n=1 Tax=Gracilibacillus timonensis TaxID=1816696 RepID=UPI000826ED03|nr:DUF4349 domain-containing protein [Gracilibacillus timonensis]
MKKVMIILLFIGLLAACSKDQEDTSEQEAISENNEIALDNAADRAEELSPSDANEEATDTEEMEEQPTEGPIEEMTERKIIYHANLSLETNQFDEAIRFVEEETESYQGYVVHSSLSNQSGEDNRVATMTLRIPAADFEAFMETIEEGSVHILDKSVNGEDVTESYVDLEARLSSKEVVEERLLSFMEEAEKTEDLLQISNDLAAVQEEIEQLKGQMNYLENQSDYATIDLHLTERNVSLPSVQEESASTWDKTKEQFMNSVGALLSFASGVFIFVIGNLPVIGLLVIVLGMLYFLIRKFRKKAVGTDQSK